ncbi:MAG: DUF481 domain-containing protein [Candidatus Latescibacterota bacterium]
MKYFFLESALRPIGRNAKANRCCIAVVLVLVFAGAMPATAQKTDIVVTTKGSRVIGEIKGLSYGKLQLSTDALSTVYIEWPKVLSVTSDKQFELQLANGIRYFGSVKASPDSGFVVIESDTLTVEVETDAIVTMERIKPNFWRALDGSIDFGVAFTQQNVKTDLNFDATVKYKKGLNNYGLSFTSVFTRQDSVENITNVKGELKYAREGERARYFPAFVTGQRNSQLDLDFRGTVGGGAGDFVVRTNKMNLGIWAGLAYAREKYVDNPEDDTILAFVSADFLYFVWGALDKELSSSFDILPVLTGESRWRLEFTLSMKWEIVHHLYINLSLNEQYDSNPPSATANNNSLYTTTSIGWSF